MRATVLQPIDQSPTDLRLIVSSQALDYPFSVLCRAYLHLNPQWSAQVCIIGESHTVSVCFRGEVVLQEVLACVPLDGQTAIHQQAFSSTQAHDYTHSAYTVNVRFSAAFTPPKGTGSRLECAFPPMWGQTPITRIEWSQTAQGLRWWTLHTYPQRSGAVYVTTASQLYFKEYALCLSNNS